MRRRRLTVGLINVEGLDGCGDSLELKVHTERVTRGGKNERYDLTVSFPRFMLRHLLEKVAEMHVRDRDRILREQARRRAEAHLLTKDFQP